MLQYIYSNCAFNILCAFSVICLLVNLNASGYQESLPYCGTAASQNQIVIVSTLDGKITALDPSGGGSELWSVHPGHEPMLSSSIHRLELSNYGQLVRMIPSLNGGLYKFNGETVEPIPLTVEHLLQASFRYSDDLVISGGKESQTLGVSLSTGEVLYECSMKGCTDEGNKASGEVLLIQRTGQVVRAVEPRSGAERWNFSVAQHDLRVLSECHSDGAFARIPLKIVAPDGLICATETKDSTNVVWKHQFDSPVVNAWEIQKGNVYNVDIFSASSHSKDIYPSLYIGMHQKQLYVQESVRMLEKRLELSFEYGKNLIAYESDDNRLPWSPVVANAKNAGLSDEGHEEVDGVEAPTTALSILYASPFVDGQGFYLYSKEAEKARCNVSLKPLEEIASAERQVPEDESDTPVTIVIVSLWYWWREVTIISVTTAIIFNFLFTRRYLRLRGKQLLPVTNEPSSRSDATIVVESTPTESHINEYESRYLSDFLPVHCLGRGGFGVVFEAKNKIDDCHYAIKRIILPDAPESRERVMREVRALAKLDHQHIVRYFNSWLESPPPGWQKQHDHSFINKSDFSKESDTPTETATSCYPPHEGSMAEIQNKVEVSDSFIVFASDSGDTSASKATQNEHGIFIDESDENHTTTNESKRKTCDWVKNSSICLSPRKVYLYIQMQLCKKESLKDWLTHHPTRDYTTILDIFEQIVRAVDYVHSQNLIHRDLKPSNIFFSIDQDIKVGDFGLVTNIVDDCSNHEDGKDGKRGHTSQVGTQLYMSPEQQSGHPYSLKVDIFSLGLILFELLVPFNTQMERLKLIQNAKNGQYPNSFLKQYEIERKLLSRMLSSDPQERPTTSEILNVPPLTQYTPARIGDNGRGWARERRESTRLSNSSASSLELNYEINR